MAQDERPTIRVDRNKEMRTPEISKMIAEGGLGNRAHYNIIKNSSSTKEIVDSQVASIVNQIVANQGVLFVKLHQYHWYVKGPHFYTLHEKFEELYNEVSTNFDAFAERLIAIGAKPYSTLKEYLEHATIEENVSDRDLSSDEMVENIIADYEAIKQLAIKGVEAAGEEHDSVTEDMLIGYIEQIDLTVWMLHAFLGN